MNHRRTFARSALALILMGLPVAATAQPESETHQLRLAYRPAELSTPTGASNLYERIKRGARRSCVMPASLSLYEWVAAKRCKAELLDRAVDRLDSTFVSAIHHGGDIQLAARSER